MRLVLRPLERLVILNPKLNRLTLQVNPLTNLVKSFSTKPSLRMRVVPVPVRSDNYAYLVIDEKTNTAAAVDPYDPEKVIKMASQEKVKLSGTILTTHHHEDHSGGNAEFVKKLGNHCKVYGGSDRIPQLTDRVGDKDQFKIGEDIQVTCLATPCHTQDSICFYIEDLKKNQRGVFTGDTLFVSGCGRFFEGTPEEMNYALNKQLGSLPSDTITYVGHEYTKSNVAFSASIEPKNQAILKLQEFCQSNSVTTGKFNIGDEKNFNVFMRLNEPEVIKSTDTQSEIDVMKRLREMKNSFQG
ncbi:beta-lactamase-like protein [Melampsora americana]|nr:beta-lactamase-like protein [Melampsora americana]